MRSNRLSIEVEDLDRIPRGLHLVIAMHGYADAAGVGELAAATIIETLDHRLLVDFDTDVLIDHRSRRPPMDFEEDRVASYTPHTLALSLAQDDAGRSFILLSGPEPDWMWDRFTAEVMEYAKRLEVASVTSVISAAMPVPHTRPLATTVSGNQPELIERYSAWRPSSRIPGSVVLLLEYRLSEHWPYATFCVLVPHYIGDSGYAGPALTALESITNATGLLFRTESLRKADREFHQAVAQQIGEHDELSTLVKSLEARYDAFMNESDVRSPLVDEDGDVPSADDIAADLQRFLAMRKDSGGEDSGLL